MNEPINIHREQDKILAQSFSVTRDNHDWLLELGKRQGDSRVLSARHEIAQGLIKQFRPSLEEGLTLPWAETQSSVRFMPAKVSIWSGPTFSGKTAFLRQLMLHAIKLKQRVLFVSLEEEPIDVWREFICMASLTRSPKPALIEWALDTFDEQLYVFDSTEMIDPTVLMGIVRFAVERFGITQVVIDSLMRLNLRIDDYEGQREMGNMLGRLARISQSHIHLIAHPRKTANSRESMDLYDIRGAQDIVAQADLVLTLERIHEAPFGSVLKLWKQRGDTNWIGQFDLAYDKTSRQLKMHSFDEPQRFLCDQAYIDGGEVQQLEL